MQLINLFVSIQFFACYLHQQALSFSVPSPPFRRFTFASNNVCIHPQKFVATRDVDGEVENLEFTMRNVPGEGDCMFLAVALATSSSMGFGGNNSMLRAIVKESRSVVAQVLSAEKGHFHVEGKRIVRAR